jgi:hypothetical protein
MFRNCFRFATPCLALGLLLVTQALGRAQGHVAEMSTAPRSTGNHAEQGGSASPSSVAENKNIVNHIINNEQLAIGRNERLLGQQAQINQNLYRLAHTTPSNPLMARIIEGQIDHQLAWFNQLARHFSLNQIHIGNYLPQYDAHVARSLGALALVAPGNPGLMAYIVDAMRLQMMLSNKLEVIQTLPPATPYIPSS